jgi:hypothetical protein
MTNLAAADAARRDTVPGLAAAGRNGNEAA